MGWQPRWAWRRDQTRDTPGGPGSARRVPSRGEQRDWQRGFPWPGEEHREPESAEEWLETFRGSQGERPAVTGSSPSRSRSRHPEPGQPSSARHVVPRYGRGEAGRPERGNRGVSSPGELFVGQRRYAEPPAARWFARPEAAPVRPRTPGMPIGPRTPGVPIGPRTPGVPIGPRTPGVTGADSAAAASESDRPGRAGAAAPGRHRASQPDSGQATREPRGLSRGLPRQRGPGSLPPPNPRKAPAPGERGLRRTEPERALNSGGRAVGDPGARLVRRPDERALVRQDAAGAAGSAVPAAAGVRAQESRMPPVSRPSAAVQPPAPDKSGWAGRHVPQPAPSTPITPATCPEDETVPLPVVLSRRRTVHAANSDCDAAAAVRPARRRADGARSGGSGALRSPPAQIQAKLDQLKDLYVTAEAIGEDALTRHFDQLSQRQRELIREYFEQAGLGRTGDGWGTSNA